MPARAFRGGAIIDAGRDGDPRRVTLSFSSEEPVLRAFGWEVLGHDAGEVDLGRIGSGSAPLLMDHRADLEHQVGVIESAEVSGGRGRAVVRFGTSARAAEVMARVKDGEVSAVSVGYAIKAVEQAGEREGAPVFRATKWQPMEISLVAIPADPSVGVGRAAGAAGAAGAENETIILKLKGDDMTARNTNAGAPEAAAPNAPAPAAPAAAASRAAPAEPGAPRADDVRKAERERIANITATGRQFDLPADMVEAAIRDGDTVAAFQSRVLDHLGAGSAEATRAGAARIGMTAGEVRQFSFVRALRYLADTGNARARDAAAFELEVSEAAAKAAGREAQGIMVPQDVLAEGFGATRASDMAAGAAATGGDLIATGLLSGSFIDILRATAILPRLGVRTLSNLSGNIAIPRQSGSVTAYWVGEDTGPTNSGVTVDQVPMTPHTLGALTEISRKLLIQSSVDVESMIRADIAAQMALAIDSCGLNGAASADAPDGLADQAGLLSTTFAAESPDYAETVGMWAQVANANAAVGSLGYALNPLQVAALMTTPKFAAGDTPIMAGRGALNGFTAADSNQVAAGDVWFGNWSDFVIGLWSGLDLTVDPYSRSSTGAVRVVAFQDVDFAVRHPESFIRGVGTATP
ncbi:phage major capsid protein [Oceanicella actignis]|nr:phage major capsid protein [Oceanicella actignis]